MVSPPKCGTGVRRKKGLVFFVHDGINSVADYDSLRVGVGWMYVGCMSDVCPQANFTMG